MNIQEEEEEEEEEEDDTSMLSYNSVLDCSSRCV